jgi:hypothetical protein
MLNVGHDMLSFNATSLLICNFILLSTHENITSESRWQYVVLECGKTSWLYIHHILGLHPRAYAFTI